MQVLKIIVAVLSMLLCSCNLDGQNPEGQIASDVSQGKTISGSDTSNSNNTSLPDTKIPPPLHPGPPQKVTTKAPFVDSLKTKQVLEENESESEYNCEMLDLPDIIDQPNEFVEYTEQLITGNRLDEALCIINEKISNRDPDEVKSKNWHNRGLVEYKTGEYNKAERSFKMSIDLDGSNVRSIVKLLELQAHQSKSVEELIGTYNSYKGFLKEYSEDHDEHINSLWIIANNSYMEFVENKSHYQVDKNDKANLAWQRLWNYNDEVNKSGYQDTKLDSARAMLVDLCIYYSYEKDVDRCRNDLDYYEKRVEN